MPKKFIKLDLSRFILFYGWSATARKIYFYVQLEQLNNLNYFFERIL